MEELLKDKLKLAKELRNYTKEIVHLSVKTEYDRVNSMIEERQEFIDRINNIDEKINKEKLIDGFIETSKIKTIKKEIRNVFREIVELDSLVRKNVNLELKDVKKSLNQPESLPKSVNIKA